jgi:hypothetical protein
MNRGNGGLRHRIPNPGGNWRVSSAEDRSRDGDGMGKSFLYGA